MRKFLIFLVALSFASSVSARDRRRVVVQPAPPPLCVDIVISVVPSITVSGGWTVKTSSLERLPAGTRWVSSLRKQGETDFTLLPGRDFTVKPEDGNYFWMSQLWNGEWGDGGDRTLSSVPAPFKPWPVGSVTTFKTEMTSPEGVKTVSFGDILVGSLEPSVGPINKVEVSEGSSKFIFLTPTGPFNSPVATLGYITVPVHGTSIEVPEEVWNRIPFLTRKNVPLVVAAEYPQSHSVTKFVDISGWEDKSKKVGNGIPVSTRVNVPHIPGSYPESVMKFVDFPDSSEEKFK